MKQAWVALGLVAALAGAGCMTNTKFLASKQTMAMQTAVKRAQFDLNCPNVQSTVLSKETMQPQVTGAWGGDAEGLLRGEYTIGVDGCGKRKTYVVLCPEGGTGCFAAGPGRFLNNDEQ
jgi:hypothetical protein